MERCIFCEGELTTGDIGRVCISCKNAGCDQIFKKNFEEFTDGQRYVAPMNGWLCPRCGTVNSPHVPKCDCSPPTITTAGTNIQT